MANFSGMDPEAVAGLADRLAAQRTLVSGVVDVVDGVTKTLTAVWLGDDMEAFASLWNVTRRPSAGALVSSLDEVVATLRSQAAQQRQASEAGSASGTALPKGITSPSSGVVRVNDPKNKKWVLDMAHLANSAYGRSDVPSGFRQVGARYTFPDGFSATLYKYGGPPAAYVLAFSGTTWENDTDVKADAANALGLPDSQYGHAVELARTLHHEYGNSLSFTGHSLGGGLAIEAAQATGDPAITFNTAEVGQSDLLIADAANGHPFGIGEHDSITNFHTSDDFVTNSQNIAGQVTYMHKGTDVVLQHTQSESGAGSTFKGHGIGHVIDEISGDDSSNFTS